MREQMSDDVDGAAWEFFCRSCGAEWTWVIKRETVCPECASHDVMVVAPTAEFKTK